jgi:hypothetical protein
MCVVVAMVVVGNGCSVGLRWLWLCEIVRGGGLGG